MDPSRRAENALRWAPCALCGRLTYDRRVCQHCTTQHAASFRLAVVLMLWTLCAIGVGVTVATLWALFK